MTRPTCLHFLFRLRWLNVNDCPAVIADESIMFGRQFIGLRGLHCHVANRARSHNNCRRNHRSRWSYLVGIAISVRAWLRAEVCKKRGPWLIAISATSNTFKLQNIQASVRVGEIHESIPIHETITRLDHLRPIRPRIEHSCRIGRHKITNLARLKRVLDIEHANASVVVGCENETRTLESARPVFPKIVYAEISALGAVVGFRRNRRRSEMTLCANRDRCTAANNISTRSLRRRWRATKAG